MVQVSKGQFRRALDQAGLMAPARGAPASDRLTLKEVEVLSRRYEVKGSGKGDDAEVNYWKLCEQIEKVNKCVRSGWTHTCLVFCSIYGLLMGVTLLSLSTCLCIYLSLLLSFSASTVRCPPLLLAVLTVARDRLELIAKTNVISYVCASMRLGGWLAGWLAGRNGTPLVDH